MTRALRDVERAAASSRTSRETLARKVREARDCGASLRTIAGAAGMSYEGVRRMAAREAA